MNALYLLDTNTVSYIAKGKSAAARARLEGLGDGETVCISAMTEAEIRFGMAKHPGAHTRLAAIEKLIAKLDVFPWGSREAAAYGALRTKLDSMGITLSEMDLLIASHAIALGAILVTSDRAFAHLGKLCPMENWAKDV
jgi:tRNA(fMet)-specific endonuclease VapC